MDHPEEEKTGETTPVEPVQEVPVKKVEKAPAPAKPPPMPKPTVTRKQLAILEQLDKVYNCPGVIKNLTLQEVVLYLVLQEGSTRKGALDSIERIKQNTVDWNEARISSLAEFCQWCEPAKGKNLEQRCRMVKELLSCIYRDFNQMTLEPLQDMNLKERRKYLESMEPLDSWIANYLLSYLDDFKVFHLSNDLNRVVQRLGLIKRVNSPIKACDEARNLFGGHKRSIQFQGALIRHATDTCISSIRVSLCRTCLFADSCPSSKAGGQ